MPRSEHHETWLTKIKEGSCALLSDDPQVNTAVVFVHGFLGDPRGTWLNFQEYICNGESHWRTCDVYFFSYNSFHEDITDSSTKLLNFIDTIFPTPPDSIFVISKHVPRIPDILIDLRTQKPTYQNLVLVGHSEGGLVIRRAVDVAHNWQQQHILDSRLALFAPAHKGVKLSGWIGACLAVGRIDGIAMPILRASPAFSEMKDKNLTEEVESHTAEYIKEADQRGENWTGLRAHVVYGASEQIVNKGFYVSDCFHRSEEGENHSSVCKPRHDYDAPITFVMDRINGVEKCTVFKHS